VSVRCRAAALHSLRSFTAPQSASPRPLTSTRRPIYVRHLPTAGRLSNDLASALLRLYNKGQPRVAARPPPSSASPGSTASRVATVATPRPVRSQSPSHSRAGAATSARLLSCSPFKPSLLPASILWRPQSASSIPNAPHGKQILDQHKLPPASNYSPFPSFPTPLAPREPH
jgi:hypothetical protein